MSVKNSLIRLYCHPRSIFWKPTWRKGSMHAKPFKTNKTDNAVLIHKLRVREFTFQFSENQMVTTDITVKWHISSTSKTNQNNSYIFRRMTTREHINFKSLISKVNVSQKKRSYHIIKEKNICTENLQKTTLEMWLLSSNSL